MKTAPHHTFDKPARLLLALLAGCRRLLPSRIAAKGQEAGRFWPWLALLALCLAGQASQAAVNVAGTIGSHTTWTAAQSPYVLQGDVVLDNDATLIIQPGVQVRMAAGASFTLRRGALQAVGTASNPIVIASDAATPAPGDWRQWRLTSGTRSAQTVLEHVRMSHGAGLVIEGSAPVLNHVSLHGHSGPAIRIDLTASPTGRNISASGNALNAIAVPSGTIRGQVVWGLVGIPYLVQQGIVQVGQAPLSLEPARLRLSPGVVAILRLATSAPAPAGGLNVDLSSSVPSVASAAARATVPAGQHGADVEVQAHAVGTTSITASHAALGATATLIEVVNLLALELAPGSPTIGVQRPYVMTLRTPQAAPAGGLGVTLENADNTVLRAPASLLVPAGQTSVDFEVTGLVDGSSRLSAQAEGLATGLATVTVRGKALVLPHSIVVAPGAQTQGVIQLTEPAPASGLAVYLASASTATATVPATVTVPAGASQARFNIQGVALGSTRLTASANGYQGAQTTVRVDAISLDIEPAGDLALNVEQSLRRRVQLSKAAPAGGVTVQLSTEDVRLASVTPKEVLVPEGQVFGLTPLTIKGEEVGQTMLHLASPGLIGKAVAVDVKEKIGLRLHQAYDHPKVVVGKGLYTNTWYGWELRVQRLVNGQVSSGADEVTVNLRCVAESVCRVPATVTIPAGQSEAAVPITGVDVGTTQIEAMAAGATAAAPMPVEVVAPTLVFASLDGQRTTASLRDDFYVTLRVPQASYPDYQYAVEPLTVRLSLSEQSPAGVVSGIYNAGTAGTLLTQAVISKNNASTDVLYVARPEKAGSYRVSAEIAGVGSGQSEVQTVAAAKQGLRLHQAYGHPKVVVGKGLYTNTWYGWELRVQRLVNGQVSSGADEVTVNLRCVAESVCRVPATVTIPAGQSEAAVPITGVDVGSTQIEASAPGFAQGHITAETVTPRLVFVSGLPDALKVGQAYRDLRVHAEVPGASYSGSYLAAAQAISVTFSSAVPSAATVASPGIWREGSWLSDGVALTGTAPGTTSITASAPGFKPVTSGVITINP